MRITFQITGTRFWNSERDLMLRGVLDFAVFPTLGYRWFVWFLEGMILIVWDEILLGASIGLRKQRWDLRARACVSLARFLSDAINAFPEWASRFWDSPPTYGVRSSKLLLNLPLSLSLSSWTDWAL